MKKDLKIVNVDPSKIEEIVPFAIGLQLLFVILLRYDLGIRLKIKLRL